MKNLKRQLIWVRNVPEGICRVLQIIAQPDSPAIEMPTPHSFVLIRVSECLFGKEQTEARLPEKFLHQCDSCDGRGHFLGLGIPHRPCLKLERGANQSV